MLSRALLISVLSVAHIFAAESHMSDLSNIASSEEISLTRKKSRRKSHHHKSKHRPSKRASGIDGEASHNILPRYASPSFTVPAIRDDLETLLHAFNPKLSPQGDALERLAGVTARHHWGEQLQDIILQFQYPEAFANVASCSSILLTGPSGAGKTLCAKDIAAVIQRKTLLIKGAAIKNQYQNSGASFLTHLFHVLADHPNDDFLVIIDELRPIIEFSNDDKTQIQQRDTATAFWQGLDECEDRQHICLICTDNMKPDAMDERIKTRFGGNLFEFSPIDITTIAQIIKKCLTPKDKSTAASSSSDAPSGNAVPLMVNNCSDEFILSKAKAASYLSVRNIIAFVEEAKDVAADERLKGILSEENPTEKMLKEQQPIIVKEEHLEQIWNTHNVGTLGRLLSNPIFKSCISKKAAFCAVSLAAFGAALYGIAKQKKSFEDGGAIALGVLKVIYSLSEKGGDVLGALSALSETAQYIGHLEQLAQLRSIFKEKLYDYLI